MNNLAMTLRHFISTVFKKYIEYIYIVLMYVLVKLFVRYIPLRLYYKQAFLSKSSEFANLQPFLKKIRLIKGIIRYLPFRSTCLEESLVVHIYFRRRGIVIPILLGVKISDKLIAHAWIAAGASNGYNAIPMNYGE